jgi:Asp/Glu/hydantoin racemase
MSTRIWYQSMAPLGGLDKYVEALNRHAQRVCSADVTVRLNGASDRHYRGRAPTDVLKYPYAKHVIQGEAIELCQRAQREGFDAVILGSFSEPFLLEIRSILDIPVVSMPEATLLVACSLAEQFALISLTQASARRVRQLVRRHGLEGRVSGYHALSKPFNETELNAAFDVPAGLIEDFTAVAEQAVKAGADLVIPAEGVLNEVLFAHGPRVIADATVMDCVGSALLYAELLVNLSKRAGIGVGRRWAYAKPPADLLADLGH